jgi:UDP-glucose 4-epimerase
VFFEKNVAAGISMLETLRSAGIKNFVFSSSAAVYGTPAISPITEDCPTMPLNAYGLTKLMLEQTLEWYARAYGWSVTAFRYFSAAGATEELGERHEPETHVIPLLLEAAAGQRSAFEIYGDDYQTPDGTCVRDFVHVRDIASAHICALEKVGEPEMRIYNIGSGESYSVRQLCDAATKVTGRSFAIRGRGRRAGDPAVLCADPRRTMEELNWKPEHSSIEEILHSAWVWKQKQAHTRAVTA